MMLGASHGFEIPFVFGHFDMGREGNRHLHRAQRARPQDAVRTDDVVLGAVRLHRGTGARPRRRSAEWTAGTVARRRARSSWSSIRQRVAALRMSPERVTRETVLADVDADPRLAAQKDKCHVYRILATFSAGLSREQYATAGKKGCAEYPYDDFPWEG